MLVMNSNGKLLYRILNWLTLVLTAAIVLIMVMANRAGPSEREFGNDIIDFNEGWINQDGREITAPTDVEDSNGTIVITNIVPKIEDGRFFCIRSSQQDVSISIDGVERETYSTKESRFFGKNSASRYVFAELFSEDAGKDISVTLTTSSIYAGRVNEIIIGRSADILLREFYRFIPIDMAALFLLTLGVVGIVLGFILLISYRRYTSIIDLSWVAIITGFWRLCESRMRQFYFNSNTVMSVFAFAFLALIPIFVLRFVNTVFSGRYRKLFSVLELTGFFVFFAETFLQITNVYDYVETMKITLAECLIFLIIILAILVYEILHKYTKNYYLTAIGIFLLFISSAIDISLVNTIQKDRIFTFIGVSILFFLTSADEIRLLINAVNENQRMQRDHAEALSAQIVETLSAAVDAKDAYTNGHSNRVAEYAREIARRMGMSAEKQKEIYWMGLLHDVGKIAVADTIINKTGKLTGEEFDEIKRHTTAGADILRNVKEMPNLQIGARWHHEKYDGKGYPDGLSGNAIPIEARIIAVADSYDAMTSYRSYRDSLPQEKVISEIENGMGTQFDPQIAQYMLEMIDEDKDYRMREIRNP